MRFDFVTILVHLKPITSPVMVTRFFHVFVIACNSSGLTRRKHVALDFGGQLKQIATVQYIFKLKVLTVYILKVDGHTSVKVYQHLFPSVVCVAASYHVSCKIW